MSKALVTIKNIVGRILDHTREGYTRDQLHNLLVELQSLPSESKEEWVSVDERLPEDGTKDIELYTIRGIAYIGMYRKGVFQTMNFYKFLKQQVTHWRKITSPPTK